MGRIIVVIVALIIGWIHKSYSEEVIVEIEVKGVKEVDEEFVKKTSNLEVGDELNREKIKDAIKRIYNTKLFENVVIKEKKKGGGVGLEIIVEEAPVIVGVEFKGGKKIKEKKLKEICGISEGMIGHSSVIFEGKVKIIEEYEKKGYYLVKVESEVIKVKENRVKVKYIIDEGKRVKIRRINFFGNSAFSGKVLRKKMKNKAKYWWPWSGKFNKEEFEKDPYRVVEFYKNNGYPYCKIESVKVIPDSNREWVEINIYLKEGKKFYFGESGFEGNKVIEEKKLKRCVKYRKGTPYSVEKIGKTLEKIYHIYTDKGYLYLNVDIKEEKIDSIVNFTYKIHEGQPAWVHKIIIQNNMKTHEKVIRRELTIFPGEKFSRKKLIVSQRKIFNLGFFKNITLDTKQSGEKGEIDLIINVEEKPAGKISLGAGWYPRHGFTLNFILNEPNFRGRGEHIYVQVEKGKTIGRMNIGYTKPWLFDTPFTVGCGLYHTFESLYWDKIQKRGGKIHGIREIPYLDYTKGRLSYSLEHIEIKGRGNFYNRMPQGFRSVVVMGIIRDSRDNFLNPTEGTKNDLEVELSGGIFGGDIHYHKEKMESAIYNKLWWRFVLGFKTKVGYIGRYWEEEVPLYKRFIVGGVQEWGLRGYKDWSIGPIEDNRIVGGVFVFIYSIELKIVFPPHNIYPLVFFDAGNCWDRAGGINLGHLKKSIGVGIRIEVPMLGLIGIDYGYRLDDAPPYQKKGETQLHFIMGGMGF